MTRVLLCLLLAACVAPPPSIVHGPGYAPPYPQFNAFEVPDED